MNVMYGSRDVVGKTLTVSGVTVGGGARSKTPLTVPLNFDVPASTVTVVAGPSGCGKTTLLNALVGLHPLLSGEVILFGDVKVSRLKGSERQRLLRSRISYVGQNLDPFPGLTALNYMELSQRISGSNFDRGKCMELLKSLGVGQHADQLLDTLSKGQLQRVMLCGGLVRRSALTLLDEPTSALDAESREAVLNLVSGLVSAGGSVVMVSHDSEIINRSDRRVMLDKSGVDGV